MRKAAVLVILVMLALPLRAADGAGVIGGALGNAQMRGQATFRWLGLPLYTARLYLPQGQAFSASAPMALQLIYARAISRQSLVDATVSELERLEGSRRDHAEIGQRLAGCFRDVAENDHFIAATTSPDEVQLYFNGAATCRVSFANIGPRFLAIWLSENSRSPTLSRQLRGG